MVTPAFTQGEREKKGHQSVASSFYIRSLLWKVVAKVGGAERQGVTGRKDYTGRDRTRTSLSHSLSHYKTLTSGKITTYTLTRWLFVVVKGDGWELYGRI